MKVGVAGRIATSSGMSLRPLICANENVFLEFCHGNFPELFLSRTCYKRPTCYYFLPCLFIVHTSRLEAKCRTCVSLVFVWVLFFPLERKTKRKSAQAWSLRYSKSRR